MARRGRNEERGMRNEWEWRRAGGSIENVGWGRVEGSRENGKVY